MTRPARALIDTAALRHNLRRARQLHPDSEVMAVVKGNGDEWICPEDMAVGVVAFGYGDGYPRHARPGTPVLVNGKPAPLVGRVSMDMITLDLREHPTAQVGDEVILWGDGLPIEDVARHAGTISYELMCHVTDRVPRVIVDGRS